MPQVASVASTSFLQMGSSKRGAAEEFDEPWRGPALKRPGLPPSGGRCGGG